MAADPAALKVLRTRLGPAKAAAPDLMAKLVRQLGADRFADREAAARELAALGGQAAPVLREALRGGLSPEARERAEKLLAASADDIGRVPPPDDLRVTRAVQALELAGTPEARGLLTEWAGGAAGARLTEEAAGARRRLSKN